jgi:hypothetical protein
MTLADAESLEAKGRAAYERRRAWSRTDSARWLNDRSAPVLAYLRRLPGQWPAHSRQIGYWLKDERPEFFASLHARLAGLSAAAREAALPGTLLFP